MRDWLSAQDLADARLPGLPATERGWRNYAEREGWLVQKDKVRARQGRGGGLEFHIDLLPPATLAAYVAKHVGAVDLKTVEAAEAARDETRCRRRFRRRRDNGGLGCVRARRSAAAGANDGANPH
jgi:putative transposase